MLQHTLRGRPRNTPAGFILPCRPTVAARPPSDAGWVHELKHDGYRLQIHVRGSVQSPKVSSSTFGTVSTTVDEVLNGDDKGAEKKK